MTRHTNELNKILVFVYIILLLAFAISYVVQNKRIDELEFKVRYLQQRDDTLTQQLQEMNRYIGYPGG